MQFRIAKRGEGADCSGNDEAPHHARPGLLRGGGGQYENAGPYDGTDTQQRELYRPQCPNERLFFRGRQYGVQWLDAPEDHAWSPLPVILSPISREADPLYLTQRLSPIVARASMLRDFGTFVQRSY